MGDHETRQESPRSCRDALCKRCQTIHTIRQNKKWNHKKKLEISGIQQWDPNINKTGSTTLQKWTTPDCRNTPPNINLEEEEIMDGLRNNGNASMPKQVKRPNPCKKMMMMMMTCTALHTFLTSALGGDEWSTSRPGRFTPRQEPT